MKHSITNLWVPLSLIMACVMVVPRPVQGQEVTFETGTPQTAPEWALLQRHLLDSASEAAEQYFDQYYDERGYFLADIRWGGNDGPDDIMQSLSQWPLLAALGGSYKVHEMHEKAWEGHLLQISKETTTHIPYSRDGMYYREFPTKMDWHHNAEWLMPFNVKGLNDPYSRDYEKRVRRYAEMYMGDDPAAMNYDKEHKIIRSLYNGSRGPLLRTTNAVDWAGDPIEIRNRYPAGHGEDHYEGFLFHFKDYDKIVGDHPQNIMATSLAYNAYILTGEDTYRDWMLEYVDAWYDRMEANGWMIPSNVGLDGTIGGETDGKWYGGTYGWSFTIENQFPGSGLTTRNTSMNGFMGFINAYMTTRDDRYLEAWRKQDDVIYNAGRMIDGVYHTPRNYGNPNWVEEGYTDEDGWYNFAPGRMQTYKLPMYWLSWNPEDRERIDSSPWLEFLEGNNPDYAVEAIRGDLEAVRSSVQTMHDDLLTPDMRLSDNAYHDGVRVHSLIRLMGGGVYLPSRSMVFMTRLRYFNPADRRSGVPEDVAVLVDRMNDTDVRLQMVNLHPVEKRTVVIQGGGYAEHQIETVTVDGEEIAIDGTSFQVILEPASGSTLNIEMERYVNKPTMAFPWDR